MTKFTDAVFLVLKQEGGYVNNPNDLGGETKYGICKRDHPNIDIKNITPMQAMAIYQTNYWQPAYDQLNSQLIINKTFSVGVDIGIREANICLQRAVWAANGTYLIEDGDLGEISVSAINSCNTSILLAALKSELAGHYRMIKNPAEIKGWLNRAYS